MFDVDAIDDAVKTLKESDPERLIEHKEFNQWLHHDFVPKCGVEGQKRLNSSLNSIFRARDSALTPKTPFHALWLKKSKTPKKSPEKALNALEDLEAQSTSKQCALLTEIDTKGFWCGQQGLSGSSAHVTSLNRLLHTYQGFEAFSQRSKQGRRFTTLLIWYQVYQELKKFGAADRFHMPGVDSDVSTAIENVAADHKVDFEMIEKRRYEANGWLRLVSQFGPGALLLVTKNRVYSDKIREDEYLLMHEYCVRHKPQILEAAKSVGGIAAQILVEGFRAHGMPLAAFLQEREDNLLTQHFRAHCKISTQTSSSGAPRLEQLADIAESQQPLRPGRAPVDGAATAEVTNRQPPENQLQRQPSAADLLSPVCMTGAPGTCSMITSRQSPASNYNFSTNAMTSGDDVAIAEVQVPEVASVSKASGRQAMQPQWFTNADQIPSQQSLLQHTPLYGVQGLAHYNLNNTSMITGQQNIPSGSWPVSDSRGLHETMAPHFLPHNDAGNINHDTVGSGYSINDEWMRTVEDMLTQYPS